ncbi:hypothetical protein ACHWQZ_G000098 [Mnemiopsis leidyi]
MKVLKIIGVVIAAILSHSLGTRPKVFRTMTISFAPDKALVINAGESQMFRAPLCEGKHLDTWIFKAKVYLMNVPWDSYSVGDDNWLHIKVSNRRDMSQIVRDNVKDVIYGLEPQPYTRPFSYNRHTWGPEDIYIQITASHGSPTYQYGLEVSASQPGKDLVSVPDAMEAAESEDSTCLDESVDVMTMEQYTHPLTDDLISEETGQYKIPLCFENSYHHRTLTVTTWVPEAVNEAPGGTASFLCTSPMIKEGICWRSIPIQRGVDFFDPSGAKVNSITPTITRAEFGPIYLLVLAQGNWRDRVQFTITTKLKNLSEDCPLGHQESDLQEVLSGLMLSVEHDIFRHLPNLNEDELSQQRN